jgi:hypothetical protein
MSPESFNKTKCDEGQNQNFLWDAMAKNNKEETNSSAPPKIKRPNLKGKPDSANVRESKIHDLIAVPGITIENPDPSAIPNTGEGRNFGKTIFF